MVYKMVCQKCGYTYWVSDVSDSDDKVEVCPICGHEDKFVSFIV